MRKLRLRPEPAVAHVNALQRGQHHLLHQLRPGFPARPEKLSFCSIASITLPADSSTSSRRSANASRHRQQHALKARPSMPLLRRKIRSAKIRLALGSQKRSQRPSALSADRRHRRLVARVHVRPLVAIHLHCDKMFVDEPRRLVVLIRSRGPSRGTSGTTPRQCPAASACSPLAPAQTPPRPTPSTPPAGASPNANTPKPLAPASSSVVLVSSAMSPAPRSPSATAQHLIHTIRIPGPISHAAKIFADLPAKF